MLQREGEVRTKIIKDTSRHTLHTAVAKNVERGAQVFTDTHPGYHRLNEDYQHESVDHGAGEYENGEVHTNGTENFWALVKRCIKGTYVSVDEDHAQCRE